MTSPQLLVQFDPEADALYIAFQSDRAGRVSRTEELGNGRQVDYDANDEILGVEFLFVSRGVDLEGVPHAVAIEAALKAFPLLSPA